MASPGPSRLLLCEGPEDVAFFQKLIEVRKLPRFRVKDTSGRGSKAAGNSRYWSALEALKFEIAIKDILIVADNDEYPATSFSSVCKQVKKVYGVEKVPQRPLEKLGHNPSITIFMLPWENELGSLESLCIEASRSVNRPFAVHVDTFSALIGADNWPTATRRHKMWLRTMLAACCVRDPFVFLGSVFRDPRNGNLIPLDHPSFQRVANVLSGFVQARASS